MFSKHETVLPGSLDDVGSRELGLQRAAFQRHNDLRPSRAGRTIILSDSRRLRLMVSQPWATSIIGTGEPYAQAQEPGSRHQKIRKDGRRARPTPKTTEPEIRYADGDCCAEAQQCSSTAGRIDGLSQDEQLKTTLPTTACASRIGDNPLERSIGGRLLKTEAVANSSCRPRVLRSSWSPLTDGTRQSAPAPGRRAPRPAPTARCNCWRETRTQAARCLQSARSRKAIGC